MILLINIGVCLMWIIWFLRLIDVIQGNTDIGSFIFESIMLIYMMFSVVRPLKAFQIRYQKYGTTIPFENKKRMKYITKLSSDKVIETLYLYQEAYGMFDYKFETDTDGVYTFTIKEIRSEYAYCGGEVKYKAFFTSEAEGSAMWLYLLESKSRSAESRYAWEMKGFFEEKIDAVRVE